MSYKELKKELKKEESSPLTPQQINNFFKTAIQKNVRIIDVQQVKANEYTLDDLFTKDITKYSCSLTKAKGKYLDNVIILFVPVNSDSNGHYQMIGRNAGRLYFFDSYGHNYSQLINKVNKSKITPVTIPNDFGTLVLQSDLPTVTNTYKLQTNAIIDETCGYHSTICAYFFHEATSTDITFSFSNYVRFLDLICDNIGFTAKNKYDFAVEYLFNNWK